jgi:hypothetical protein
MLPLLRAPSRGKRLEDRLGCQIACRYMMIYDDS